MSVCGRVACCGSHGPRQWRGPGRRATAARSFSQGFCRGYGAACVAWKTLQQVVPAFEPVKKSSQFPANGDSMEMWAARFLQDHKHGEGWRGPDCGCEPGATVLGPHQSGWRVA